MASILRHFRALLGPQDRAKMGPGRSQEVPGAAPETLNDDFPVWDPPGPILVLPSPSWAPSWDLPGADFDPPCPPWNRFFTSFWMLLEVALLLSLDIFLGCFSKLSGGFLFRKPPQGLEHMARAVVDRSAAPSRKAFSICKTKY